MPNPKRLARLKKFTFWDRARDNLRQLETMQLVTFQEAAELIGINVKTIHRHIAKGKLHPVETPFGRRLKRTDLDPYLQTQLDKDAQVETASDAVPGSPGQSETESEKVLHGQDLSKYVPIAAMKTALEFAERRIAEERERADQAYRLTLSAERAKMSLEVQLNQYQRVLSEQAESLAEERALRLAAESQLSASPAATLDLPNVTPKLDTPVSQRGWGQRLKSWLLGSKTG